MKISFIFADPEEFNSTVESTKQQADIEGQQFTSELGYPYAVDVTERQESTFIDLYTGSGTEPRIRYIVTNTINSPL